MSDVDTRVHDAARPMSLPEAATRYGVCLAGLVLGFWGAAQLESEMLGMLTFMGYFIAGFHLNRNVLRRVVDWHPMYNTLENVTNAKLYMFFLWPLAYLGLIFRLFIDEVL